MSEPAISRQTFGGAASATAGTALIGAAADLANISPWWAAAAVAPAVASMVKAHLGGLSMPSVLYRAGCWACAGAWVAHAAADTAWTKESMIALASGGLASYLLSPVLAWRDRSVAEQRRRLLMLSGNQRRIDMWERRLANVCSLKGHAVTRITPWDNGFGETVRVSLVGTGREWKHLKKYEGQLATDGNLPNGCGVAVHPGATRGEVELRVTTKDAFNGEYYHPLDDLMRVTSIDDPIRLGRRRDGEPVEVSFRWKRAVMVGPPDSGKTNELRTIIRGILQTNNAVIRIVDLNGGGLAWSFLTPWFNGEAGQPAIDWVGYDDVSAAKLAADTLWECKRRKTAYPHLLMEDDKLPAGTGKSGDAPPAIILIVDEGAEVGGKADSRAAKEAARDIAEIDRIGRAVSVNVVKAYLRGTTDMTGGTANKRLSDTRILMKVTDAVEGSHVFGNDPRMKIDPHDAPHSGCGWYSVGGAPPVAFMGDRTVGQMVRDIAIITAARRPQVYPSPNYATRWDGTPGNSEPVGASQMATVPSAREGGTGGKLQQIKALANRVKARRERLDEQRGVIRHDPTLAEQFADALKGLELPPATEPQARLDVGARMIQVVREAGTEGISGDKVLTVLKVEGYSTPSRATIFRWLGDAEEVVSTDRGWVHRDNLTG